MKYQILLLTTLVVTLSISLFAATQIFRFYTERHVVIGSWDEGATGVIFSEENDQVQSQVLGLSTQSDASESSKIKVKSFHGFLFDKYFASHNSPLFGFGEEFVKACNKYDTPKDCTLLPAIAKIETDLCKTGISAKQYNCWGWGGSGSNRIIFHSFPEAVDTITGRLKVGYGDRFFENANNGALTYCGRHCVNYGNHVESEKRRINQFFQANGHPGLF